METQEIKIEQAKETFENTVQIVRKLTNTIVIQELLSPVKCNIAINDINNLIDIEKDKLEAVGQKWTIEDLQNFKNSSEYMKMIKYFDCDDVTNIMMDGIKLLLEVSVAIGVESIVANKILTISIGLIMLVLKRLVEIKKK